MGVVDLLELVEVGEQDRSGGVRALGAMPGVLQACVEEQPVRKTSERVMQRAVVQPLRREAGVVAGLRIEKVCGGDVGEGLGRCHVLRVELSR